MARCEASVRKTTKNLDNTQYLCVELSQIDGGENRPIIRERCSDHRHILETWGDCESGKGRVWKVDNWGK